MDVLDKLAIFGASVWLMHADNFWCSEDGWQIAEYAVAAGMAEHVRFDPAIHHAEDVEPGDDIIWPIVGDVDVRAVIAERRAAAAQRNAEAVAEFKKAVTTYALMVQAGARISRADREAARERVINLFRAAMEGRP
jgi:hypothetical protein